MPHGEFNAKTRRRKVCVATIKMAGCAIGEQYEEQAARDLEILNRRADYLNAEVADALHYQASL